MVWSELESKKYNFWCEIVHNRKSVISVFQEFSSSIKKTFILVGRLDTKVSFYAVWTLSWFFLISKDPQSSSLVRKVVKEPVRQLVYTVFISNNHASFHLCWKKNLVKHKEISKYYKTDCLQYFLLVFTFLLTAKFVKNSHIYARMFFIVLKSVPKQTWSSVNTKYLPQLKDYKSSYEVKEILGFLCQLSALILG